MPHLLKSFRRRTETESAPRRPDFPKVPEGVRIYAIGDIHGRADLLSELHEAILVDAITAPGRRVVVYLGDYVDRGTRSRDVLDMLIGAPLAGFEAVHLKGNHEAALLQFLKDPAFGPGWMHIGGAATLASYGVAPPSLRDLESLMEARDSFARSLPREHVAFLLGLALHHEAGDYYFVHAGIRPNVPLAEQSEEDLTWIRDEFLRDESAFDRVIVHGHSIVEQPDVRPNRIAIDTGAFVTGQLTCLVLEGRDRRFIST